MVLAGTGIVEVLLPEEHHAASAAATERAVTEMAKRRDATKPVDLMLNGAGLSVDIADIGTTLVGSLGSNFHHHRREYAMRMHVRGQHSASKWNEAMLTLMALSPFPFSLRFCAGCGA